MAMDTALDLSLWTTARVVGATRDSNCRHGGRERCKPRTSSAGSGCCGLRQQTLRMGSRRVCGRRSAGSADRHHCPRSSSGKSAIRGRRRPAEAVAYGLADMVRARKPRPLTASHATEPAEADAAAADDDVTAS